MPSYEAGDFVKVEFKDSQTGEREWMWVRVESVDDAKRIIFGWLDSQPILAHSGKLRVGSQLAVSYENVVQHKKADEL